nr:hypothetical protein BaRGS_026020 [Batillaria attramentaria]
MYIRSILVNSRHEDRIYQAASELEVDARDATGKFSAPTSRRWSNASDANMRVEEANTKTMSTSSGTDVNPTDFEDNSECHYSTPGDPDPVQTPSTSGKTQPSSAAAGRAAGGASRAAANATEGIYTAPYN